MVGFRTFWHLDRFSRDRQGKPVCMVTLANAIAQPFHEPPVSKATGIQTTEVEEANLWYFFILSWATEKAVEPTKGPTWGFKMGVCKCINHGDVSCFWSPSGPWEHYRGVCHHPWRGSFEAGTWVSWWIKHMISLELSSSWQSAI